MSTYTESKHVRGGNVTNTGQYSAKVLGNPAVTLAASDVSDDIGMDDWREATTDRPSAPYRFSTDGSKVEEANGRISEVQDRYPTTRSEARKALSCPRLPHGTARVVCMESMPGRRNSERDDHYTVVGPKSGTPLIIMVESGYHHLNIESGRVIVEINDCWGGGITATGGEVDVIVNGKNKQHINIKGDAQASIRLSENAHSMITTDSTKAVYLTGGHLRSTAYSYDGAVINQDGPVELRALVKRGQRKAA